MTTGISQSIPEFYAGRSILLTGGTGFLGKGLLYKLLSACPQIDKIYLLVRPKKDVDPRKRVDEIIANEVFDPIRISRPDFDKMLIPVPGDIAAHNLGISDEDLQAIIENVSVVFHCAATVDFNMMLRSSFEMNVLGAAQLINMAKSFKNLKAFVHVSTAYSQCDKDYIEEKFYEPDVKPDALYEFLNGIKDVNVINKISNALLQKRPNTYTFTKSLAESVVQQLGTGMPMAVMRPSIIGGVHDGQVKGWTDNLNGAAGLYLAVGYGLLRVMPGDENAKIDIVPVDFCASLLISIAWHLGNSPIPSEPIVYNCTSGKGSPKKWGPHNDEMRNMIVKHNICGRPLLRVPTFKFIHPKDASTLAVRTFFEMKLPVYLADAILFVTRQRPKMRRLYRNLEKAIVAYSFFTCNGWEWDDENSRKLRALMNEKDRKTFNFDWVTINWLEYYEYCWLGLKKFARLPANKASSTMAGRVTQTDDDSSIFKYIAIASVMVLIFAILFQGFKVFYSNSDVVIEAV